MNRSMFRGNVGWRMHLTPPVSRLDRDGHPLPEREDEDWIVEEVTDDYVALRSYDGYGFKISFDSMVNFNHNPELTGPNGNYGMLLLKVQIFLKNNKFTFVPNARPGERVPPPSPSEQTDLIALGPEIVGEGLLRQIGGDYWTLELSRFVVGSVETLIAFIGRFEGRDPYDRYVLLNALGDGRSLTAPPVFVVEGNKVVVTCVVAPAFRRIRGQQLGSGLAVSPDTNDLFVRSGQLVKLGEGAPNAFTALNTSARMLAKRFGRISNWAAFRLANIRRRTGNVAGVVVKSTSNWTLRALKADCASRRRVALSRPSSFWRTTSRVG